MLTRLSIRNIVLIEKLDLDLAPGLSVLTGETGAGKSILLDSLGLGLGARGDAGLLRQGADQASVSLTFSLPKAHAALAALESLGLEADSQEPLILRRTVGRDGRSRAFINDQPVQVGVLKKVGETLVDIHGQFEAHGLLNRETHLDLLDAFAGIREDVKQLGLLFSAWKEAEQAYS
jgi:DNA repair protein RecN (Recombination protein N)